MPTVTCELLDFKSLAAPKKHLKAGHTLLGKLRGCFKGHPDLAVIGMKRLGLDDLIRVDVFRPFRGVGNYPKNVRTSRQGCFIGGHTKRDPLGQNVLLNLGWNFIAVITNDALRVFEAFLIHFGLSGWHGLAPRWQPLSPKWIKNASNRSE